jgi:hypothetical protein
VQNVELLRFPYKNVDILAIIVTGISAIPVGISFHFYT